MPGVDIAVIGLGRARSHVIRHFGHQYTQLVLGKLPGNAAATDARADDQHIHVVNNADGFSLLAVGGIVLFRDRHALNAQLVDHIPNTLLLCDQMPDVHHLVPGVTLAGDGDDFTRVHRQGHWDVRKGFFHFLFDCLLHFVFLSAATGQQSQFKVRSTTFFQF